MILISKYLIPKGYTGLAVYPFVVLKNKGLMADRILVNHECIHLKQQLELLIIPFYVFYVFEFLIRLLQYRSWKIAYRNISFEREAYGNECDFEYLKSRKIWQFLKYIRANDF